MYEALKLGPVGGIFNLAVVLKLAIFENQNVDTFNECLRPKVDATRNLDELSRRLCPDLKHFVVFSSISCGRGYPGLSNYALGNSVMERIVEQRRKLGLPGKAIQWGAISDVGLLADFKPNEVEVEVTGTFAQEIRSCLNVLDSTLTSDDSIVSSMVISDKKAALTTKDDVIETIFNIMALRDKKSIPMNATLSLLGIDSPMGVEIRQVLERDFNASLSIQELRSLTLAQLVEKVKSKSAASSLTFEQPKMPLEIPLIRTDFGEEKTCRETILRVNESTKKGTKVLMIPGLLGMAGELYNGVVEHSEFPAFVMQLYNSAECTEVDAIVESVLPDVLKLFDNDMFVLVAHSFGTILALKIAHVLESKGKAGKIVFVDGSPDFVGKIARQMIPEGFTNDTIKERILRNAITIHFMDASGNALKKVFERSSWDERIEALHELLGKARYSFEYVKKMLLTAMFNRLKMCLRINQLTIQPLKTTSMILVKSSNSDLNSSIEDDFGLKKYSEASLDIHTIEGDHMTVLANPDLHKLVKELSSMTEIVSR